MSPTRPMAIGLAWLIAATLSTGASAGQVLVTKLGEVASLADLAKSHANREALLAPNPAKTEMPRHLMPDGKPQTTQPPLSTLPLEAPPIDAHRAPSPVNFTGLSFADGQSLGAGVIEPSDMGLAANNHQVVQAVNLALKVLSDIGAQVVAPVSLYTFFNVPNQQPQIPYFLSDPVVLFDQYGGTDSFCVSACGRFIVTALITDFNIFNAILVAVSKTSDATGGYFLYMVSAQLGNSQCAANTCLADFPKVGYDANGIYLTADLFAADGSGAFVGAAIYALPKAALEAGANNAFQISALGEVFPAEFVIVPMVPALGEPSPAANGGTMYFQTARNIMDGSRTVRTFAIYNTSQLNGGNPALMTLATADETAPQYNPTVFMTQPQDLSAGPECTSAGYTKPPALQGGYNSLAPNVVLASGNLFGAIPTGARDASGLAVNQILVLITRPTPGAANPPALATRVATAARLSGSMIGTGISLGYPSFALKTDPTSLVGASGVLSFSFVGNSSTTTPPGFPSVGAIAFSGNPVSVSVLTFSGTEVADGFTCATGAERWGDYSMSAVDAVTGTFFSGMEFTPGGLPTGQQANWGTGIIATSGIP